MPTNCVLFTWICTYYTRESFVYETISVWFTVGSEARMTSVLTWNSNGVKAKTNQGEWQGCTHAERTFSSPTNWCSLQREDKQGYTVCSSIQHTFPMYCCVPIALLNALDANSIKVNIIFVLWKFVAYIFWNLFFDLFIPFYLFIFLAILLFLFFIQ